MIKSYDRSVIGNNRSFLYSLCFFVLFFPHKLYYFSILLIIIFIFKNWYICLILFRVLWIFECPYNGCLCISCISYFCSFRGIYSLLLFSFICLLCFRICWCRLLLLFVCIIMLARFLYRK